MTKIERGEKGIAEVAVCKQNVRLSLTPEIDGRRKTTMENN